MAQQDQPSASNANKASEENPSQHPLRRESEPGQPPNAPRMSFSDTVTTPNLPKSLRPNNIPPRRPLELNTSPTAGPTQSSRTPLQPITPELFSRSFYGNVKTPRGVRPPSRPAPQHRSPSTSDTHHKQTPITETEREASKKKTRRHEIEATKAAIAALREKLARLTAAAGGGAGGGKSAWAAVRGPGKAEAAGPAGAEGKSVVCEDERAAFADAKMGVGTSRAEEGMNGRKKSGSGKVEIAQGYRDNAVLKIPRRKGGNTATNSSTPSIPTTE
ncbi:hypothetical protein GTA08_BOTSDO09701 [Botryosphaeria dothidea]|uniref:Uncharacterized protein n=1 Tax=Botryosphaeria dothidea TaxID=55169 RepID=A0A8H4N0L2_9PEZI|nr:hypothetical protein GTA08_BOTSDO09701 [Botryosphaeria dothidea]